MRILVTGGTGLLGWWLVRDLARQGYTVHATYHSKTPPPQPSGVEWVRLELESPENVQQAIEGARPSVVIHSAAYTDVDGCEREKERAYRVNYLATLAIARAAKRVGAHLVYISTDYVFDGEKGLYSEDDAPAPVNYYGLTKLLGEVAVSAVLGEEATIVRVSGLYGYAPTGKRNFGIHALEKLLRGEEVKAFYDQYLSPTYVEHLATRIRRVVEKGISGLIHVAGERASRHQFAVMLAEELGANKNLVKPVPMSTLRLAARRPRDSSLDTSKARGLGVGMPGLRTSIKRFIETYRELVHRQ